MFALIIILAITFLALLYYYITYSNRIVTKFIEILNTTRKDNLIRKRIFFNNNKKEKKYIDIVSLFSTTIEEENESLLVNTLDELKSSEKYNSPELITLLWYGNSQLIKSGKCFNKDLTMLIVLGMIIDLVRLKKVEISKNENGKHPIITCIDKRPTGNKYYDFCLKHFENKNFTSLHIFANKVMLNGINLREDVFNSLKNKGTAKIVTKRYLKGKLRLNFWTLQMPMEYIQIFKDLIYKDDKKEVQGLLLVMYLIFIADDIVYQKSKLLNSIFGKNEIEFVKEKINSNILENSSRSTTQQQPLLQNKITKATTLEDENKVLINDKNNIVIKIDSN